MIDIYYFARKLSAGASRTTRPTTSLSFDGRSHRRRAMMMTRTSAQRRPGRRQHFAPLFTMPFTTLSCHARPAGHADKGARRSTHGTPLTTQPIPPRHAGFVGRCPRNKGYVTCHNFGNAAFIAAADIAFGRDCRSHCHSRRMPTAQALAPHIFASHCYHDN